jgi:hypothetical protein
MADRVWDPNDARRVAAAELQTRSSGATGAAEVKEIVADRDRLRYRGHPRCEGSK